MSEMVERVARALCRADGGRDPDHESNDAFDEGQKQWTLYVGDARAAIEAMREPTHAIFMAGRNFAVGPREADSVRERWKKQIDAALDPSSVEAIDNVG